MEFRKEREYLIKLDLKYWVRFVCNKITKNEKGEILSYTFLNTYSKTLQTFSVEEVSQFLGVIEPVDNSEFFPMYINWCNFSRPGLHQDLAYAEELRLKILETLDIRSFVNYGTGYFNNYDLKLLIKLKSGVYV